LAHGTADLHEAIYKLEIPKYIYPFFNMVDPQKVQDLWHSMASTWQTYCERYSGFLSDNGGQWLVGDRVSWADLFLAELNDRVLRCLDHDALEAFPLLKQHCQRVHQLPNIKKYCDSRKPSFTGVEW